MAKKSSMKVMVTEEDRLQWWDLTRKYLKDVKHPNIQRWAWKEAAPYINPKLASQEMKSADKDGFKIVVEDYRGVGSEEFPIEDVMHTTLGKVPLPDSEEDN